MTNLTGCHSGPSFRPTSNLRIVLLSLLSVMNRVPHRKVQYLHRAKQYAVL